MVRDHSPLRQDYGERGGKEINEVYVVDAITFGEAEESITREMRHFIDGDFEVKNISTRRLILRFSSLIAKQMTSIIV